MSNEQIGWRVRHKNTVSVGTVEDIVSDEFGATVFVQFDGESTDTEYSADEADELLERLPADKEQL